MSEPGADRDLRDALRAQICTRLYEVEPGQFVRCQSRRSAVCPSCAGLYRGDWERIARSGIYDADGPSVSGYRHFFITLSAPSFGKVHRVPKPWDNNRRRCHCGATHRPEEVDLLGLPINLDDYDYEGQVRWHGALGRLWRSSVVAMRRRCPDAEYFAVREVQGRMALHVHAVVRVPVWATVDVKTMGDAARSATATHPVTGQQVRWGQKGIRDREIRANVSEAKDVNPDNSRAAARIVSYVGKALGYSLKDVTPGSSSAENDRPQRIAFLYRLRAAARHLVRCPDCPESGPGQCDRRAHDNLGYGGHVVTVSRPSNDREGWSLSHLTRKRLRKERRAWMEANRPNDVRNGVSANAVKLSRWLRTWLERQGARRARNEWESRRYARAP